MPAKIAGFYLMMTDTVQFLLKRLLAGVYELLVLTAIWMLVTLLFVSVFGDATQGVKHWCLQLLLWLVAGIYFVRCWSSTGQTLALQAWRMKIVDAEGGVLSVQDASIRYVLASVLMLMFGVTILWELFDRDKLFLHDRWSGTRCVKASAAIDG